MKNRLLLIAFALFIVTVAARVLSFNAQQDVAQMQQDAKEYVNLRNDWSDKKAANAKFTTIIDDCGTKYFSVSIDQKQINDTNAKVSFSVLNSAELDAIIKRILDGSFKIDKLEVIDNEIGYLVTVEVLF